MEFCAFPVRENTIVLNVECGELNAPRRCSHGFKACEKCMLPSILKLNVHLALTVQDAHTLQIRVGVSIVVSFTFSQSYLTHAIFSFLCFRELSFQRSHRRLLTLR